MINVKKMGNQHLILKTREAANNLSFYNAAEGSSWRKETAARNKASIAFNLYAGECRVRGIDWRERLSNGRLMDYLV